MRVKGTTWIIGIINAEHFFPNYDHWSSHVQIWKRNAKKCEDYTGQSQQVGTHMKNVVISNKRLCEQ